MIINSHTHNLDKTAGINLLSFFHSDEIPQISDTVLVSCGIHPWHVSTTDVNRGLDKLRFYCESSAINAIGECGLDKLYEDVVKQEYVFVQQVHISEAFQLPLIIHSVKSYNRVLEIRKRIKAKQAWILHGFVGSCQIAQDLINSGIYLSFGAALLRNSEKLNQVLKKVDLDFVLLETDEANISVTEVYEKAESLLDLQPELLERQIYNNFKRIFSFT